MTRFVLATALSLSLCGAVGALAQQGGPAATESREEKIARLVRELGDASFEKRSAAQKELEALGRPAVPALEKAAQSQDPEVATRAAEALARIRGQVPREEEPAPTPEAEDPVAPPLPPMPQMPDMDQMWKEMQEQMPPELGELFKRMLGRENAPQGEEENRGQRFKFQMRRLGPNGEWEVIEDGSDAAAGLGMSVGPANAALRAQLSIEGNDGVVVNQLRPGGLAERSGLKLYDVIVAVDGRAVRSARDLEPLKKGACKLELYRKAQLTKLETRAPEATAPAPQPAPTPTPQPQQGKGRSF